MNTKQVARKLDLIGKEDLRRRTVGAVMEQGVSKAEAGRMFAKLLGLSTDAVVFGKFSDLNLNAPSVLSTV